MRGADVAAGDFDCPNFQRFLVYTYVYLTPDAAFGAAMLSGIPLSFTFRLDACAIHCPAVAARSNERGLGGSMAPWSHDMAGSRPVLADVGIRC